MKRALLSVFFILIAGILTATTIIIYITPDFAIMAVDSKGVFTNAKTYEKTSRLVAKIYKTGNVYFSVAGLTSNAVRSFDVGKLADANLKSTPNLKNAIDSIKLNVKEALTRYLINQKKNNYSLFKKNIEDEAYITSIGIIAIRNNKPYAHIIGFKVTDGSSIKVTVEEEFYAASSNRDAVYYLGTAGEIDKYMNSINKNSLNAVSFVDKLMQLQIDKTPDLVGPPIDIIKLTSKDAEWIGVRKIRLSNLNK